MTLKLTALFLLALTPGFLPRQDRDIELERRGRAALGRAQQALGTDNLPRMWLVSGQGRENLTAELQGRNPNEPTWREHREQVAVDRLDGTVGWERRTPRNDESLRHRTFVYGPSRTLVVDTANQFHRSTPGDVPASRRRALMRRIPHLLIEDFSFRSSWRVQWLRESRVDGRLADDIAVDLPADTRVTLTIDRQTGVPHAAAYDMLFPGRGTVTVRWEWTGWTPHAKLGFVPRGHRMTIGGDVFQEVSYSRYEAAQLVDHAYFMLHPDLMPMAMPAAPPAWTAGAGPAEGEVAPGVHVARLGGFTILFADIGPSIVAFEAPEPFVGTESIPASNRDPAGTLTPQVIAHIRKTIPGKPISHVVISHHHGDHAGGAAAFKSAGAEIVTRETRLGEGNRQLHVLSAGPNPHTDDNLVLWIPHAGVLIQGDLFYFDAGSGFHRGRDRMNRFFAAWLRERGITPRLIYGVHNDGAAGAAALDQLR